MIDKTQIQRVGTVLSTEDLLLHSFGKLIVTMLLLVFYSSYIIKLSKEVNLVERLFDKIKHESSEMHRRSYVNFVISPPKQLTATKTACVRRRKPRRSGAGYFYSSLATI